MTFFEQVYHNYGWRFAMTPEQFFDELEREVGVCCAATSADVQAIDWQKLLDFVKLILPIILQFFVTPAPGSKP